MRKFGLTGFALFCACVWPVAAAERNFTDLTYPIPRGANPAPITELEPGHRVVFDGRDGLFWNELKRHHPRDGVPKFALLRQATAARRLEASKEPLPMQLLPDVYVVGDQIGWNRHYLVDCGEEGFLLIDTGRDRYEFKEVIPTNIAKLRLPTDVPKWVWVTHAHTDHSINARYWQERGSKIMIHEGDAHALATASLLMGGPQSKKNGNYVPPCTPDMVLRDGDYLQLGNKSFTVIHTPGHTPGSALLLMEHAGKNIVFSGDVAFFNGGLGAMANLPGSSWVEYLASAEKMERVLPDKVDALLPGHFTMVVDGASRDLAHVYEQIRQNFKARMEGRSHRDKLDNTHLWEGIWRGWHEGQAARK